jgi:hypothetical protein
MMVGEAVHGGRSLGVPDADVRGGMIDGTHVILPSVGDVGAGWDESWPAKRVRISWARSSKERSCPSRRGPAIQSEASPWTVDQAK